MSASSFHNGLPSRLANKSHIALTTAAVARWMAPFSGPIQRNWLSRVTVRQNRPMSEHASSTGYPSTNGRNASTAEHTTSVPRPIVKVKPWPSSPSSASVRRTTYAAEQWASGVGGGGGGWGGGFRGAAPAGWGGGKTPPGSTSMSVTRVMLVLLRGWLS